MTGRPLQSTSISRPSRKAVIAQLAAVPAIHQLSLSGLKTVTSFRLLAICARSGHDPLLELTHRHSSVTIAKAFLAFADLLAAVWPEQVQVMRPCSQLLSADEWTLAALVEAGAAGDRSGAGRLLDGFVRADRHERVYERAVELAAQLH